MDYLVGSIYSSESAEWYTPGEFTKAAAKVMSGIELDPASCELANRVVGARCIYTEQDDGLTHIWNARSVFLNPPYGRVGTSRQIGKTELWVEKLIHEVTCGNVEQAILLVNAYLYKQWFAPLWQYPICFPTGRLSFWNAAGQHGRSPHSSALVYFGEHIQRFVDVFSTFGVVVKAMEPHREEIRTLWDEIGA